jgi:hypothetical protein
MSNDRARSNQTCACDEPFSTVNAGVAGLKTSAAFADELTAMAITAAQALVAVVIALSLPADLDPSILELGDPRIGWDRQLRLALGQHLEAVRRNAAGEEALQHSRGAALGKFKVDLRIARAIGGAGEDHNNGLAFIVGSRGVIAHGLVLFSDRGAACDTNSLEGVIAIPSMSFDGLVGTDVVIQSSGNRDAPAAPSLSYSIGSFVNRSDENLDANFAVSDTDFRGPANLDLEANAAFTGADGSNLILGWFADPNNTQGGETLRLTRPE